MGTEAPLRRMERVAVLAGLVLQVGKQARGRKWSWRGAVDGGDPGLFGWRPACCGRGVFGGEVGYLDGGWTAFWG